MFDPESPPELAVTRWLNARAPLSLKALKGQVVVVVAFQMLCPGCVSHALPQAKRLAEQFSDEEVVVVGLHSVFEHHAAMGAEALEAFVQEYGWAFPIGIDTPNGNGLPRTMAAYEMRGTPTLLIFDRQGRLRRHYFGHVDDMRLAAEVMVLAIEEVGASREASLAIERKLQATLVDPHAEHHDHHHEHDDECGCGHDHDHQGGAHDHAHGNVHGDVPHHVHGHVPRHAQRKPRGTDPGGKISE